MSFEEITVHCQDEFPLAATIYRPTSAKGAIMLGPATGIRRGFYHKFCTYLAEQGYGVISYDNRGIGDSRNGDINAGDASLITWGKLDMTAILNKLQNAFPGVEYHLIGHSAGGQLVGLMENALQLRSMFNVASSSGWLKNMRFPFKLSAQFFMNIFIPVSNLLFGHTKSHWVGMGEPLPKDAAAQWRRWCNHGGYCAADFGKAITSHHYHELQCPSKWIFATDDEIAVHENVKDMARVIPNSPAEIVELNPKELGLKELGHMKFFSSKNHHLWTMATDWIQSCN